MKLLLISIPILLLASPDTARVDTTQKEMKLFFEQRTADQVAKDIDMKLSELIKKLEAKNDTLIIE